MGFSRVAAGSLGFLSSCDGTLGTCSLCLQEFRPLSEIREGHQKLLLSCCQRRGPCLEFSRSTQLFLSSGDRDLRFPLKVQLGVRSHLVSRHGTRLSSRVVKGFSGLLSSSGGKSRLFQEDQQGCQAFHHVVRGSSVTHWSARHRNQDLSR